MAKKPAKKPTHAMARADYGQAIDGFIEKRPPEQRAILTSLRKLVEAAEPKAESAIKWGMPVYSINGKMFCSLGAHKAHVNLVVFGKDFDDPDGLLEGESKNGKHLRVTNVKEIPSAARVKAWIKAAAAAARAKA